MKSSEIIRLAWNSVRANILRATLTLMIIAVGITALVGILTAIDALLFTMNDNFSRMGANSFSISPSRQSLSSNREGRRSKRGEPITFRQALDFKERYDFPATVSLSARATSNAEVKYANEKTNPTIRVVGVDENFVDVNGLELQLGRDFTRTEQSTGSAKAIIGMDLVKTLFDDKPANAINKIISIGSHRFRIVGVLASKGASMNQQADRQILIPLLAEKRFYGYARKNYSITVAVPAALQIDEAISSSVGTMRNVRRLRAGEENDFETFKSDGLLEILKENTVKIRIATIAIGLITLLGASIGLMNIMLVSVTERTREIGISKALGATRRVIMSQFLTEAVIICQLGGVVGVLLGWAIGNGVAKLIGGNFLVPWAWIGLGFITCFIVGIISGLYPAMKASRLDPIEALRYE